MGSTADRLFRLREIVEIFSRGETLSRADVLGLLAERGFNLCSRQLDRDLDTLLAQGDIAYRSHGTYVQVDFEATSKRLRSDFEATSKRHFETKVDFEATSKRLRSDIPRARGEVQVSSLSTKKTAAAAALNEEETRSDSTLGDDSRSRHEVDFEATSSRHFETKVDIGRTAQSDLGEDARTIRELSAVISVQEQKITSLRNERDAALARAEELRLALKLLFERLTGGKAWTQNDATSHGDSRKTPTTTAPGGASNGSSTENSKAEPASRSSEKSPAARSTPPLVVMPSTVSSTSTSARRPSNSGSPTSNSNGNGTLYDAETELALAQSKREKEERVRRGVRGENAIVSLKGWKRDLVAQWAEDDTEKRELLARARAEEKRRGEAAKPREPSQAAAEAEHRRRRQEALESLSPDDRHELEERAAKCALAGFEKKGSIMDDSALRMRTFRERDELLDEILKKRGSA